jgi:hypothetical protein
MKIASRWFQYTDRLDIYIKLLEFSKNTNVRVLQQSLDQESYISLESHCKRHLTLGGVHKCVRNYDLETNGKRRYIKKKQHLLKQRG